MNVQSSPADTVQPQDMVQPQEERVFPLEDLTWICTSLCDLLEFENEALSRHDAATVRDLTENKTALAKLYEKTLLSLDGRPDLVKQLTPDDHASLSHLGIRLAHLMERNTLLLRAEMEARQRVMDIFVAAAKASAQPTTSYGKRGSYDDPKTESGRTSLTFNKML